MPQRTILCYLPFSIAVLNEAARSLLSAVAMISLRGFTNFPCATIIDLPGKVFHLTCYLADPLRFGHLHRGSSRLILTSKMIFLSIFVHPPS